MLKSKSKFRFCVLHTMTFVDDHINPFGLAEDCAVFNDEFVGCKEDLPVLLTDGDGEVSADLRSAFVTDYFDGRCPSSEFESPIGHGTERDDDKERTRSLFLFHQECNERDCLNRFSETHFVCEDTVEMIVV